MHRRSQQHRLTQAWRRPGLLIWAALGISTLRCGVSERLPPGPVDEPGGERGDPDKGGEYPGGAEGSEGGAKPTHGGATAGGMVNSEAGAKHEAGSGGTLEPIETTAGAGAGAQSDEGGAAGNAAGGGTTGNPTSQLGGTSGGSSVNPASGGASGTQSTTGDGGSSGGATASGGQASGGRTGSGGTLNTGGKNLGGDDEPRAGRPACFVEGTPVTLANGTQRAIEEIRVGDEVLSYDPEQQTFLRGQVVQLFVHPHTPALVEIDHRVTTTPEHPFFASGRFKRADALNLDEDRLFEWIQRPGTQPLFGDVGANPSRDASTIFLSAAREHELESLVTRAADVTTYNLEVVPSHTYFAAGFLVHNLKPIPEIP
ncbi:MAG TPA: Hint domain-containing protein [Polyangiaceae bacterium]|nr:Hint domain-containing protein [Polyangiaceae bacterium]